MKSVESNQVERRVREIAQALADQSGLELVLVEFLRGAGRATMRLTIDREGGVTLDDCASFSRRVGAELEAEDPIPGAYTLEVSSPGLDRRLVKEQDYARFRGRTARITLRAPLEGRRNFQGVLEGLEGSEIVLAAEGGQTFRLPVDAVERANLVAEL